MLIFLVLVAFSFTAVAESSIILDGNYQGKNLYVQNPFASSGVGFCTYEVTVNGQKTTDEINSSAFEIDFESLDIKLGDKVRVEIKHKDDCKPKVLNPQAIKPKSTFDVIAIKVDDNGTLSWETKNEIGKLPYVIEQFRWNKWVKVGELEGNGSISLNKYDFKIMPHFGVNQFRVKQVDASREARYSQTVRYRSPLVQKIEYKISKSTINFTNETMYEVYNKFGEIVKKGYGSNIDISSFEKGNYYLNYDNSMDEFKK